MGSKFELRSSLTELRSHLRGCAFEYGGIPFAIDVTAFGFRGVPFELGGFPFGIGGSAFDLAWMSVRV